MNITTHKNANSHTLRVIETHPNGNETVTTAEITDELCAQVIALIKGEASYSDKEIKYLKTSLQKAHHLADYWKSKAEENNVSKYNRAITELLQSNKINEKEFDELSEVTREGLLEYINSSLSSLYLLDKTTEEYYNYIYNAINYSDITAVE